MSVVCKILCTFHVKNDVKSTFLSFQFRAQVYGSTSLASKKRKLKNRNCSIQKKSS